MSCSSSRAGAGGLAVNFALGATRSAAGQAGLPNAVTEQKAADLVRETGVPGAGRRGCIAAALSIGRGHTWEPNLNWPVPLESAREAPDQERQPLVVMVAPEPTVAHDREDSVQPAPEGLGPGVLAQTPAAK